jgi:hypothetical protein
VSAQRSLRRWWRRQRRRPGVAEREAAVRGLLVWAALWLLRRTTRLTVVGSEALEQAWRDRTPVVVAFWHGRSIMLPFLYRERFRAGPALIIMNSPHRDGEMVTRALARFGIRSTRGSSSRGGVGGTIGLARALRTGSNIALVPDGPRGPAGTAKPGAVELAASVGALLFPLSFSASRAVRARSWDRLMLPLPGSRVVCVVGPALDLPVGRLDRDARERLRAVLEAELAATARAADRIAGRTEESA